MFANKTSVFRLAYIILLIAGLLSFAYLHFICLSSVGSEDSSSPSPIFTSQAPEVTKNLLQTVNLMATTSVGDLFKYIKNLDNGWWQSANADVTRFLNKLRARRNTFLNSLQALNYKRKSVSASRTVYIATAACEKRGRELAAVMLKSAILFGQHTNIHAYVFTDPESVVGLSLELLELKWTKEILGGNFSFRILEKTFPKGWNGSTYAPCATQRLFFTSALPEVDAVLYMDADTLFLSNLTRIWELFKDMNATAFAAAAPNTEGSLKIRLYYTPEIPIYGNRGINAGIMLMNLTRMRDFKMEERAIAVEMLYGKRLLLADQDIYNIIFHFSPDKLHVIDCAYNFYYVHCLSDSSCAAGTSRALCFCDSTLKTGVKILHGAIGTFNSSSFMRQAYQRFKKINLLAEDALAVVQELAASFRKLRRPCPKLNPEALYGNAIEYLKGV